VYLKPETVVVALSFVQLAPALTAPEAGTMKESPKVVVTTIAVIRRFIGQI
jgi:hypothetical protein